MYQFSNSEYERTHGRKPRGKGCWIFEVREYKKGVPNTIWEVLIYGTLTEAKRKAAQVARQDGIKSGSTITVCP